MAFKDTLSRAIEKSGLTAKEISNRCEQEGLKITEAYISKLRTGKQQSPSEQVIKVLAKVLEIDEQLLLIEAYLDNSPEVIKDFIDRKRRYEIETFQSIFAMTGKSNDEIENILISLSTASLAEYIYSSLQDIENIDSMGGMDYVNNMLGVASKKAEKTVQINDDSMEPYIPKNSTIIIIEDEGYKDKDIVGFINEAGIQYLRNLYYDEEGIILTANNPNYEPMKYKDINEIQIVGKVKKIIITT